MKENIQEDDNDEFEELSLDNNRSSNQIDLLYDGLNQENTDTEESKSELNDSRIKTGITIYKIKDLLMFIFLLLSSSVNFSILYIPLIIIGMSYIFLLLEYNNGMNLIKRKLEIISLIYSLLLLAFKSVFIGMIQNENINYDDYESILNNLGIKFQKDKERGLEILFSFIGEIIVIIISVISIIISCIYKEIDYKKNNISTLDTFNKKIKTIIYLGYVTILINSIYNKSFLTLVYLISYQFLLIIHLLKVKSYNIFKIATFIYLCFFALQLLLINIFNIYYIQEKLLKVNFIPDEKYYSVFTMIGINYSYYHSLLNFIYEWISYVGCVLTIALFTICQRLFKEKETNKRNNNIENNGEKKEEEKKIKNNIYNFITSPNFILFFFRLISLLWIYILRHFFSLGIFTFLFFSFLSDDINIIYYLIIFLLTPIEILTISFLHVSNINGISESLNDDKTKMSILKDFAYEKDETNIKYILVGIYYCFIIGFFNSYYYNKDGMIQSPDTDSILINLKDNAIIGEEENKEPLLRNTIENHDDNEKNIIKEEKEIKKINIKKEEENDQIKFKDVLLKTFYSNIDKINLVAMYFISMLSINIIHLFFIIIFMIQILKLNFTKKYSKLIIILIQILFLFEYLVDLTKNYYIDIFEEKIKLFQFLLSVSEEQGSYTINIDNEIFCYVAVFVFYFQNKLLTSDKYLELKRNKKISISNYINIIFQKSENHKKLGLIIGSFILEIYIYAMFCIFFLVCCNFEINLLISVKLWIFLLVIGGYIQKTIQRTQNFFRDINVALKVNNFLIGYCCFSSLVVYAYQLICLDFFGIYESIQSSDHIIIKNFTSIGLIYYENKNLLYKLLPHFLSNFLSILLYNVMHFIYERIDKRKKDNIFETKIHKDDKILINDNNENDNIIGKKEEENINNQKENIINDDNIFEEKEKERKDDSKPEEKIQQEKKEDEKNIDEEKRIEKEINNKEGTDKEIIFDIDKIKEEEEILLDKQNKINDNFTFDIEAEEEKYKLINLDLEKEINHLNVFYFLFLIINFILKLYSPSTLLLFCYIFTSHKMSVFLIIYFLIISINLVVMFKKIIKSLKLDEQENNQFPLTKIIKYRRTETKTQKNLNDEYDYKIYKLLTYFSLISIFLSYLYSIIYGMNFKNCNYNKPENEKVLNDEVKFCNLENTKYGNYISSLSYILGIYNYSAIAELFDSNSIYFIFFILIIVSKYIKMIIFYIENLINKNREIYNEVNLKTPYLKTIITYIKRLKNEKNQTKKNQKDIEELISNYENLKGVKNAIQKENENFRENFEGIFKKANNNITILVQNSLNNKIIYVLKKVKKFYEHFIIFAIISCIIFKINIWSMIYMIIIIVLLLNKKTINNIFNVFVFLVVSTLVQTLIFVLNINKNAFPENNEKIFEILNNTLSIPFYENFLGEKSIENGELLGVGINRSQILLIWNESVLLFLIYIYLYYFSFSIFNEEKKSKNEKLLDNISSKTKTKINNDDSQLDIKNDIEEKNVNSKIKIIHKDNIIFRLLKNENFEVDISNMTEDNYKKIVQLMSYNFKEELPPYEELKEVLKLQQFQKNEKEKFKNNRKNEKSWVSIDSERQKYNINISNYIIYLFLHNIILIIILVIAMMCPGILSAIVICLCLYFLYFAHLINKGQKTFYPFFIQRVLRIIIIYDISFQLITQIILIYYPNTMKENNTIKYILEIFGFREILNENYEITGNIIYLLGKNFCFFCVTIQKIIYSSNNFREFYLSYIIKMKIYSFKLISSIHARIFNNHRIKEMNDSLEIKLGMEKSMKKLKEQIKNWSKNLEENFEKKSDLDIQNEGSDLSIFNNNNINIKQNEESKTDSDSEEEEREEKQDNKTGDKSELIIKSKVWSNDGEIPKKRVKKIIKDWILGQTLLIKIYKFFNKRAYYLRFSSYTKEGNNIDINLMKGKIDHTPNIIKKINHIINKLDLSKFNRDEISQMKILLNFLDKKKNHEIEQYLSDLNKEKKENNKEEINTIKELLKIEKFRQFLDVKNSSLFKKYITKWYLIKKITSDFIIIVSNNFCWICYFFMILNHMINASIISIFYPLSIFCYALLENPRPSKSYWRICYIYTFIFLLFKCFFQKIFLGRIVDFSSESGDKSETRYESLKIFFEQYPIGIKIYDENSKYFLNLTVDFLLLISLIINRNILLLNGLWEHKEEYFEDLKKAMERVAKYNSMKNIEEKKDEILQNFSATNTITNKKSSGLKRAEAHVKKIEKGYYEKLFPKLRNEKPGKDFYYLYAFAMIFLIIYVLIFYTTMVKDKTYGYVNISTNQFSGMSIILVLIHMIILIIDRIFYLGQNRYKINYEYIFFDENDKKYEKIQSKGIIQEKIKLNKNEDKQLISYGHLVELSEKYNVSILQKETFNYPLLRKYVLHMIVTVFSHLFIFSYITIQGNYNIYNASYCIKSSYIDECNDFQENVATIIFYIIYLFYFTFSALQIKYGFYDIKRPSIFKNVKSYHPILFEIYKIIPFYYPIKNIIDWTVTPTSFGIFDWFKFEYIYDDIFKTYRLKYKLNDNPIGQPTKTLYRILSGGICSSILVLLLIFPLILFSSLNPTGELNNISSATLKLYLSFEDINKQERNILFFENNWAKSISNMTNEVWNKYNYSKSIYTKSFPLEQIQIISFYSDPENSLSEFKINHTRSSLESLFNITESDRKYGNEPLVSCYLKMEIDFIRPMPSETRNVKKQSDLLICDYKNNKSSVGCKGLEELYKKLNNTNGDNTADISFNILGFSPIVRLGAAAEPIEIEYENEFTTSLIFKTKGNDLFELYFENVIENNGVQFHVMNEKVSSGTFGYTIIGFYSTFILVIGTYVANFCRYDSSSIVISEMPHPEMLLKICEGIKISRYLHDFKNEEYYFNFLIEILRTPELVKKVTTSTLKQFNERRKLPA